MSDSKKTVSFEEELGSVDSITETTDETATSGCSSIVASCKQEPEVESRCMIIDGSDLQPDFTCTATNCNLFIRQDCQGRVIYMFARPENHNSFGCGTSFTSAMTSSIIEKGRWHNIIISITSISCSLLLIGNGVNATILCFTLDRLNQIVMVFSTNYIAGMDFDDIEVVEDLFSVYMSDKKFSFDAPPIKNHSELELMINTFQPIIENKIVTGKLW